MVAIRFCLYEDGRAGGVVLHAFFNKGYQALVLFCGQFQLHTVFSFFGCIVISGMNG